MNKEETQRLADELTATADPRVFVTVWDGYPHDTQARVLRVLAARVARLAVDGVHHRSYHTIDAELDAMIVGIVETVRHRLPERDRVVRHALRISGPRSYNAPWRLVQIIRMSS
jgi:hypothetical protein